MTARDYPHGPPAESAARDQIKALQAESRVLRRLLFEFGPGHGVASLGRRPPVDDSGRVLLEVHCLEWPAALGTEGAYGKIIRVELLHKLHDELKYDGLDALTQGIRQDCEAARAWFSKRI